MEKEKEIDSCLNCGEKVDKNYCPECGQKKEEKHHFYHLFSHFISDFVHYDSSFWRSVRMLFSSPGKLSVEYLEGKRKRYVSPFSLYIFVSIIAFFAISFYPASVLVNINEDRTDNIETIDDVRDYFIDEGIKRGVEDKNLYTGESVLEFAKLYKKDILTRNSFLSDMVSHLPKLLFVYMPIFAFWLWLFYRKRRRYYFDSGIFTLHLFAVALLCVTFCSLLSYGISKLGGSDRLVGWITLVFFLYTMIYYLWATKVFYKERTLKWIVKSLIVMFINAFFILLLFISYVVLIAKKIGILNG